MREQAVYDHGIYRDNGCGSGDNVDAQPWDGDSLVFCKRIVEGVVVERESLVEWWDLVDDGEGHHKNTVRR